MAKRTDKTGWTASGNFNTVRFDAVKPDLDKRVSRLPDNIPFAVRSEERKNKFIRVCPKKCSVKQKNGDVRTYNYWQVSIKINGRLLSKVRDTEIKAAIQYDNWIKEYGLNRTTNYDLYGEYWK